jgi:hypothetical protein
MKLCALPRFAALIVLSLALTTQASAVAPQRTFVSAQHGNDANSVNNCSVTLPCRNFATAVGVVLAGGEVVALDSGGYGPVVISKAVTLTGPTGVYVAISAVAAGSSAIAVSAGSSDTVVLRGLTLTGLGGQAGITVTSVRNLHVEGCVISGFTAHGILVSLTADGSHIFVNDSVMRNNGAQGIIITTTTGVVRASIDNSRAERNGNDGFFAYNNSRVTINRSVASGNGTGNSGFIALSDVAFATAELNCEECVSTDNGNGFTVVKTVTGSTTIRVSHSVATSNIIGFAELGGTFRSLVNNLVEGNETDVAGTIDTITVH